MRVSDLFEALLLESANDAAVTLAEGISGSARRFVAEMNERAPSSGSTTRATRTRSGSTTRCNYSTARDLASLTFDLMQRAALRAGGRPPAARARVRRAPAPVENRNLLIGAYPFVNGVKTGHTSQPATCWSARRGPQRRAGDLGGDGRAERGGARRRHARAAALGPGPLPPRAGARPPPRARRADIEYRDEQVASYPTRGAVLTLRDGERVSRACDAPDEVSGPLAAGERVGSVTVLRRRRAGTAGGAGHGRRRTQGGDTAGARLGAGRPLDRPLVLAILLGASLLGTPPSRFGSDWSRDDHHRHPQRRHRQDARRAELPARPAPPRGGADRDGGRQGRERGARAARARPAGDRDRRRRRARPARASSST